MREIKVACVQMAPTLSDIEGNTQKMADMVMRITDEQGALDFIIFPELATTGYENTPREFAEFAEGLGSGCSVKKMRSCAAAHNVNLAYGFAERREGRLYNSCVYIDRNGNILDCYRKVHPFDTEKNWCVAGSECKVISMDFGRVGAMICYDASFPEYAGTLSRKGAEMLAIATNWEKPYAYDWDLVTKARAFDNNLYVVAANRAGADKSLAFFGNSRIVSPVGQVICSLGEEEGYCCREIDLAMTERLRHGYYTTLRDRRPDIYQ